MTDRCEISRCRAEAAIRYLDHGVCDRHWSQLTAEDAPPDALRISLGIEAEAPAATEGRTMEPTTEKSTKKNKKAAAKPKAAKEPKPKKEKAPKQDLVVFAFRLAVEDRDLIHKAAGQGKATKFVLGAALAACKGDRVAFEELAMDAKANLK